MFVMDVTAPIGKFSIETQKKSQLRHWLGHQSLSSARPNQRAYFRTYVVSVISYFVLSLRPPPVL
jgi:hypothetical protein